MVHNELPPVRHLLSLANAASFPATCQQIIDCATKAQASDELIRFLYLFPMDEVFESKSDFMTRCEEIELLIALEQDMSRELTHSPEGRVGA